MCPIECLLSRKTVTSMNGFMLNHKTIQQIIFQGAYLQKSCLKGILWFEEPSWLKSDVSKWPVNLKDSGNLKTIPEERVHMHFAVNVSDLDLFSKFSSLTKLKRVVALCKRFIFNLQHPNEKLVAAAQQINVSNNSHILSLNPFLDQEGILRVGGRLTK